MRGNVVLIEDLCELAVVVLHAVALVDDHVLPLELGERSLVLHDVLVGCEEHVEPATLEGVGQDTTLVGAALKGGGGEVLRMGWLQWCMILRLCVCVCLSVHRVPCRPLSKEKVPSGQTPGPSWTKYWRRDGGGPGGGGREGRGGRRQG